MKCSNCGNELNEGAQFCANCGAQVEVDSSNETVSNDTPTTSEEVTTNNEPQNAGNSDELSWDLGADQAPQQTSTPEDNASASNDAADTPANDTPQENQEPASENTESASAPAQENGSDDFSFGPSTTEFMNANNGATTDATSNQTQATTTPAGNTNNSSKKFGNKLIVILGAVFAVALIAIVAVVFFFKGMNKPKTVFVKVIDNVANMVLSPTKDNHSKISESLSFDANITTADSSANEIFDIINKLKFSMDASVDYTNKLISGNFLVNYDNNKLIQADVYAENNFIYLKSADLYDKYIKVPYNYNDFLDKNGDQISAYNTVVSEINKALEVSLKDSYFKASKETINVNGQNIKATKNELSLNKDNIKQIEEDILTYLLNSTKYISAVAKINGDKENEVKEDLKKSIESLGSQSIALDSTIIIDIYTKGLKNEFVKLRVSEQTQSIGNIELTKSDDNTYDLVVNAVGQSIKLNLKITEQDGKKTYTVSYDDGQNKAQINIGLSVVYDKDVVKADVSNAVDMNTLAAKDLEGIMSKLESNSAYKALISDVEKLSLLGSLGGYSTGGLDDMNFNDSFDLDSASSDFNF